jgi:hypothetical protein
VTEPTEDDFLEMGKGKHLIEELKELKTPWQSKIPLSETKKIVHQSSYLDGSIAYCKMCNLSAILVKILFVLYLQHFS